MLLPNVNIQFAFKKNLSLKRIFLPILKGKDEQKTIKNLVYSIPGLNCNKAYIGETSRMKEKRMAEHRTRMKMFASDSKIVEHIEDQKHSFAFTRVKTLTLESNWQKRTIKESLLTHGQIRKSLQMHSNASKVIFQFCEIFECSSLGYT